MIWRENGNEDHQEMKLTGGSDGGGGTSGSAYKGTSLSTLIVNSVACAYHAETGRKLDLFFIFPRSPLCHACAVGFIGGSGDRERSIFTSYMAILVHVCFKNYMKRFLRKTFFLYSFSWLGFDSQQEALQGNYITIGVSRLELYISTSTVIVSFFFSS